MMYRKKALKLAINAAEKRLGQLTNAHRSENCVLCKKFGSVHCKTDDVACPALESDFDCTQYCNMVDEIVHCLTSQIKCWQKELSEL